MPPRRFPVPWTFEDHNNACFIVKDANGLAVAYCYYEEEPGRRTAANLMTKDESRRIAANIVKLPGLRRRQDLTVLAIRFAQIARDAVYVSNSLFKLEFSADALDLSNGLFEPLFVASGDGTQSLARLCLLMPTSMPSTDAYGSR